MATGNWALSIGTSTFEQLSARLHGYFKRRVPSSEDPRDFVAQVWLAAGKSFEGRSSLHHFAFQVARRLVAGFWRKEERTPEIEDIGEHEGDLPIDAPGCETALQYLKGREDIAEALALVDPVYREAVRLWLEGRDAMQIADALGVQYNTARSRIARGRRQLLENLA